MASIFFRNISFCIACIFTFGGLVNYGTAGIIPAVPMILFLIFIYFRWGKKYRRLIIIFFAIAIPLYFLKFQHGVLFHPILGSEVMLNQDGCLEVENRIAFIEPLSPQTPCKDSNIVLKGAKFKVKEVGVSNGEFVETYFLRADTNLGLLYHVPSERSEVLSLANGEAIKQSDLHREIFFWPSTLMLWPMSPVLLLKMKKKFAERIPIKIIDDSGTMREGFFDRELGLSLKIKPGDTIEISCRKSPGFREARRKGCPVILPADKSEFWINFSADGIPEGDTLTYK